MDVKMIGILVDAMKCSIVDRKPLSSSNTTSTWRIKEEDLMCLETHTFK